MNNLLYKAQLPSGKSVEIFASSCDDNPREWECNLGKLYVFKNRYFSADGDIDDVSEELTEDEKDGKCKLIPVYAHVHSAICLSLDPFNDCWDSALCGYYVVDAETAMDIKDLRSVVMYELRTYEQYLNGEAYGYTIYDKNGQEIDELCGVFDVALYLHDYLDDADLKALKYEGCEYI